MGNLGKKVSFFFILLWMQLKSSKGGESQPVEYETKFSEGDVIIPNGLIRSDYDNFERPSAPQDENGANTAEVHVLLYSFPDFQEDRQELSIDWVFKILWRDSRFNEFTSKHVDESWKRTLDARLLERIWHPHIYLDSLKSNAQASIMGAPGKLILLPTVNTSVYYEVRSTIQTICETDYTYYPFDVIVCPVTIRSYLYDIGELVLYPGALFYKELEVPGFQISTTYWKQGVFSYEHAVYSTQGFKILLKRDMTSNLIQVYIPSLVFIIICFGSFTLNEASDRIACTTLSLLSLFVLLGTIGSTPQGSYVTYIHLWVLMCILIVFLPVLEIFVSLKLKNLAKSAKEENQGKEQAKMEAGDGNVEACSVDVETQTKERQRNDELRKIIWLVEKTTPIVVIGAFVILNIIYWYFLIQGSHGKFEEHSS